MSGTAGTERTIRAMERLIREGTGDTTVIYTAGQLVRGIDQKDYLGQASKLFSFVQNGVQYVRDPVGVEYVKTPLKTLHDRTGDCDDQAVLFSALARAIGFTTRLKAIKSDPRWPGEFSHVFSQVNIPGRGWVTSDTIVPTATLGWEAPKQRQFGSRVWGSDGGMSGMNYDIDASGSSFADTIVSSADLDLDVEGAGAAFGEAGLDVTEGADAFGRYTTPETIADQVAGIGFDVDEGVEGMYGLGEEDDLKWYEKPPFSNIIENSVQALLPQQQQQQIVQQRSSIPKWLLPVGLAVGGVALVLVLKKKRR